MKFSVQIYDDSFEGKVVTTVSNTTVSCNQSSLGDLLKSFQTSLRLKPSDPLYTIRQLKVKLDGKYCPVAESNFDTVKSKINLQKGKVFAKVGLNWYIDFDICKIAVPGSC